MHFFIFCTAEWVLSQGKISRPSAWELWGCHGIVWILIGGSIYLVYSCVSIWESETQRDREPSTLIKAVIQHVHQSHRGFLLGSATAPVIRLIHFTLLISPVFWLHQSVFTPLMSPLLNACFSTTTPEYPWHRADGRADAGSKIQGWEKGEMDVCVHKSNIMRLFNILTRQMLKRWSAALLAADSISGVN